MSAFVASSALWCAISDQSGDCFGLLGLESGLFQFSRCHQCVNRYRCIHGSVPVCSFLVLLF